MLKCSSLFLLILPLAATPAFAETVAPIAASQLVLGPAAARAARADSMWLFAPSGPGAYGELGTDARGYDFDGTGECWSAGWTGQNSAFVALRENDFLPGANETCMWTFFDPELSNPEYPMGIIPYGPPYVEAWIESPPLEVDPAGNPLDMAWDEGSVILQFDVYKDLPLDPLIFYFYQISGRGPGQDYGGWLYYSYVFYGEEGWITEEIDISAELHQLLSPHTDTLAGVKVRLGVVDMCELWCGSLGSGENHTLGPLFDNVRVAVVTEPTGAIAPPPTATELRPPRPNPFNPATRIELVMSESAYATVDVIDLSGRVVRHLAAERFGPGLLRLDWDGRDDAGRGLAAGVYLVSARCGDQRFSRKAVLLK